jgi:hypothetical protein
VHQAIASLAAEFVIVSLANTGASSHPRRPVLTIFGKPAINRRSRRRRVAAHSIKAFHANKIDLSNENDLR